MTGLIFATKMEAGPFLSASQTALIEKGPIPIYQIDSMPWLHVAISGMGKVAAAAACQFLIRELGSVEIINAGAAGALVSGRRYTPGSLFCVTSTVEGDHELLGKNPQPLLSDGLTDLDLPPARLVTCDIPVFDSQRRKALAEKGDLVDMEGAAIARIAAMFEIPWTMIKGISDAAGPTDRSVLMDNLKMVSRKIGGYLHEHLQPPSYG
jgi:adenosylhomocysteine nucleosidase